VFSVLSERAVQRWQGERFEFVRTVTVDPLTTIITTTMTMMMMIISEYMYFPYYD